jgi:aspartyl-tRNA(Asn)/glutamyl-tRNA(Gln) amidotransferase subunit A
LDSVGVIAPTVNCCHAVDAALQQERLRPLDGKPLAGTRFVVAHEYFMDGVDASVSAAFERALAAISQAGARFETMAIPELHGMREVNSSGGLATAESFAYHQRLHLDMEQYDPRVRERILRGNDITDARYSEMLRLRHGLIASFAAHNLYDGLVCPTVPIIAPPIRDLEAASEFHRVNLLLLRNPSFANFFELCSVSLPCHRPGDAPVGLMLTGRSGSDQQLLSTALGIERALGALRSESSSAVIH